MRRYSGQHRLETWLSDICRTATTQRNYVSPENEARWLPRSQHSLQTADTLIKYSCGHGEETWEWTHSGWRLKKKTHQTNQITKQQNETKVCKLRVFQHVLFHTYRQLPSSRNLYFIVTLWHIRFGFYLHLFAADVSIVLCCSVVDG